MNDCYQDPAQEDFRRIINTLSVSLIKDAMRQDQRRVIMAGRNDIFYEFIEDKLGLGQFVIIKHNQFGELWRRVVPYKNSDFAALIVQRAEGFTNEN